MYEQKYLKELSKDTSTNDVYEAFGQIQDYLPDDMFFDVIKKTENENMHTLYSSRQEKNMLINNTLSWDSNRKIMCTNIRWTEDASSDLVNKITDFYDSKYKVPYYG